MHYFPVDAGFGCYSRQCFGHSVVGTAVCSRCHIVVAPVSFFFGPIAHYGLRLVVSQCVPGLLLVLTTH